MVAICKPASEPNIAIKQDREPIRHELSNDQSSLQKKKYFHGDRVSNQFQWSSESEGNIIEMKKMMGTGSSNMKLTE